MVLFFTHIPFVVNHTINAAPPERLQHFIPVSFKHNLIIIFRRIVKYQWIQETAHLDAAKFSIVFLSPVKLRGSKRFVFAKCMQTYFLHGMHFC